MTYDPATNAVVYSGDPSEANYVTMFGNGNTVSISDTGAGVIRVDPAHAAKFNVVGDTVTYVDLALMNKVRVFGNDGEDTISGAGLNGLAFAAFGDSGNDTIYGSGGDDTLEGATSNASKEDDNEPSYRRMKAEVKEITGKGFASFQGQYQAGPKPFVVRPGAK